jgi:hypothetical protein
VVPLQPGAVAHRWQHLTNRLHLHRAEGRGRPGADGLPRPVLRPLPGPLRAGGRLNPEIPQRALSFPASRSPCQHLPPAPPSTQVRSGTSTICHGKPTVRAVYIKTLKCVEAARLSCKSNTITSPPRVANWPRDTPHIVQQRNDPSPTALEGHCQKTRRRRQPIDLARDMWYIDNS